MLVWWAHIWKRKHSCGNGRWSCPWGEQISSAAWAPPTACIRPLRFWAHTSHGHLTVQHRDSNFTLCTKCKVMQLPSNEKQRRSKPKVPIREWRTLWIGKWAALLRFLRCPQGAAILAGLWRQPFETLQLFPGTWTSLSGFWWLLSYYFNIQLL